MRADFEAILREASTASDLDEVLAIIVRRVKGALPVDVCAVYLTDSASDQLVRVSSSGADPAGPKPVPATHLSGLLNLGVARRELVVLPNPTAHPTPYPPAPPEPGTGRYNTFLGMPLIHDHPVLGVLGAWEE